MLLIALDKPIVLFLFSGKTVLSLLILFLLAQLSRLYRTDNCDRRSALSVDLFVTLVRLLVGVVSSRLSVELSSATMDFIAVSSCDIAGVVLKSRVGCFR